MSMITALPAIPLSLGAHRVVRGLRVEHLCGDPNLSPERDWELMYGIATTASEIFLRFAVFPRRRAEDLNPHKSINDFAP